MSQKNQGNHGGEYKSPITILTIVAILAFGISLAGLALTYNYFSKFDMVTGMVTGTANVTVPSVTTITLPTSSINFGSMAPGASNDTTDGNPAPITIQNDGNVNINITVEATDLWSTSANPSDYYRFSSAESEAGSVVNSTTDLISGGTQMPATGSGTKIGTNMKYAAANDLIECEIYVQVPAEETPGSKSSTITFTASQA